MQVDPMYPVVFAVDPALAFRDFQRLKVKYEKLLSNFGFNCKLRPHTEAERDPSFIAVSITRPRSPEDPFSMVGRCRLTPGFRS